MGPQHTDLPGAHNPVKTALQAIETHLGIYTVCSENFKTTMQTVLCVKYLYATPPAKMFKAKIKAFIT